MSIFKKFLPLVFVVISMSAFGQAAKSPFSTYGVGEVFGGALIQNQGMGGAGVSQPMYWSVNNQNPALLVNNYYTTFQAGMLIESRTFTNDSASQKGTDGNLNYLVVGFPVMRSKKHPELMQWSTSVSLLPFSKVNYKLKYADPIYDGGGQEINTLDVTETGTGGLSQVSWGNGIRISRALSVGINASYLFGSTTTDYTNYLVNTEQPVQYTVAIKEQTYMRDFLFTGGLAFSQDSLFKSRLRFTAGLTYQLATNIHATKTTVQQRRNVTAPDTLVSRRGPVEIPSAVTFGVSLGKPSRWSATAEFSLQDWSDFRSLNQEDEGLRKSWKAILGGELTPDQTAFKSYLKRVTYRAGVSFEKTPYAYNGSQLNDMGVNLGFSLPAGRSSIDWAFRVGKRGDKSQNGVEETYYKIFFGISFVDQWFYQRKID